MLGESGDLLRCERRPVGLVRCVCGDPGESLSEFGRTRGITPPLKEILGRYALVQHPPSVWTACAAASTKVPPGLQAHSIDTEHVSAGVGGDCRTSRISREALRRACVIR